MRNGFDRIGPFHPYVAFGAVILLNLLAIILVFTALVWLGDRIEDHFWPGGTEWVDF